jgi:hypothetical protein
VGSVIFGEAAAHIICYQKITAFGKLLIFKATTSCSCSSPSLPALIRDGTAAAPAWLEGGGVRREAATGELQLGSGAVACRGNSAQGRHCGERRSRGRCRSLASARRHLEQAIQIK